VVFSVGKKAGNGIFIGLVKKEDFFALGIGGIRH
jgi:RNA polymerase sigma-70 factor, ECF subfamily